MADQISTERFSAGYELVHGVDVETINDDEAIIDLETKAMLEGVFGQPLVALIGGLHYQFKPTTAIPARSVAVPKDNHDDPESFLIRL